MKNTNLRILIGAILFSLFSGLVVSIIGLLLLGLSFLLRGLSLPIPEVDGWGYAWARPTGCIPMTGIR